MKKVKVLFFLILVLLLFPFLKLYFYSDGLKKIGEIQFDSISEGVVFVVYILIFLTFIFAHFLIAKGLWLFTKKGFFNSKSVRSLKIGGVLLFSYGLIVLGFKVYYLFLYHNILDHGEIQLFQIIENSYTIILGFGLIVLTDILKNGLNLKKENDLTI